MTGVLNARHASESGAGVGELPIHDRFFGAAKVEIVGDGDGFCANATEVAGGFGNDHFCAFVGVEIDVSGVTIYGGGYAEVGVINRGLATLNRFEGTNADNCGIGTTREHDGIILDLVVVLTVDPAFGGDRRCIQQG